MILGWDGLGLSSYILVIYYQNPSSRASGLLTILTNRLGDIIILISIATLFYIRNWNFHINIQFPLIILILFLLAAATKRAQFPFSAWLPAAIAAPTPISALVHSSTLVTAGIYLIIRISSNTHPFLFSILILTSRFTAIYSRLNASWEQDIKKIIALSTLRQIAIIIFSLSINLTNLAFFHLITHAIFKSTIFLCAGIVIHHSSYQDLRQASTSHYNSPITPTIINLTNIALIGIPFISGFYSKDSIIESIIISKLNSFSTILIISSIGITITYSIRIIIKSSNKETPIQESTSPKETLIELTISSIRLLSIFIGTSIFWLINPSQIIILPLFIKIKTLLSLLSGIIIRITLNFKRNNFVKLGHTSIYIWFINILSSNLFQSPQNFIKIFFLFDNSWKEIYGPQGFFYIFKFLSHYPNYSQFSYTFLIIIILILPTSLLII